MSEENKNTITYDDNWKSVSKAEYPVICSPGEEKTENTSAEKKDKESPKQLLITIQLVICIIIALAAFIIKGIGGDVYSAASEWYYTQLNDSAIFENSDNFNFKEILGTATNDEV